jgi:RNA polymerase sigma factor (sigma-70 family)
MLSDDDVTRLISQCAGGDRAALRLLFEREAPRMIGVAERIVRRRALAEEVAQDAFVQIWRKAASFNSALGSGRTWLYTIVRNRALNILRDESRTELAADPQDLETASEEEDAESMVARLGEATRLRACLERLEPERRNAIVLAYTRGLSHGELAGKLGLPLGTIKSWIRRGMATLKECLS